MLGGLGRVCRVPLHGYALRSALLTTLLFASRLASIKAFHWRVHYNTVRPHSSLGYRPPAPETWAATSLGSGQASYSPYGTQIFLICVACCMK